jgi:AcrR family transcriptional regulator
MGKGELTRQSILEHAMGVATQIGLEGITIGRLAEDLSLSKSGLFAHFQSKEALQLQVLEHAASRFVETVVRPALAAPRGERRVRAVFEHWLAWASRASSGAGCFFVAAAAELDDRPGPARDALVAQQREWMRTLATVVRTAIAAGHFDTDTDPEQFAFELYGVMLACHHAGRLLGDARAARRAQRAFETLLASVRAPR